MNLYVYVAVKLFILFRHSAASAETPLARINSAISSNMCVFRFALRKSGSFSSQISKSINTDASVHLKRNLFSNLIFFLPFFVYNYKFVCLFFLVSVNCLAVLPSQKKCITQKCKILTKTDNFFSNA